MNEVTVTTPVEIFERLYGKQGATVFIFLAVDKTFVTVPHEDR